MILLYFHTILLSTRLNGVTSQEYANLHYSVECYVLTTVAIGCDVTCSGRDLRKFRKHTASIFRVNSERAITLPRFLFDICLFALLLDSENGGVTSIRNVRKLTADNKETLNQFIAGFNCFFF
jgi:hypothetical protein